MDFCLAPGGLFVQAFDQLADIVRIALTGQQDDGVGALIRHEGDVFVNPPLSLSAFLENGREQGDQFGGVGVFHGDDGDLLAYAGDVDGFDDLFEPSDIGLDIRYDQGVGGRIRQDNAVSGYQRGEQPFNLVGVGVSQRDELGYHIVPESGGLRFQAGPDALAAGVGRGDDLGDLSRRHGGVAIDFENGEEDAVGFIHRNLVG
jgi:hypothetical protein